MESPGDRNVITAYIFNEGLFLSTYIVQDDLDGGPTFQITAQARSQSDGFPLVADGDNKGECTITNAQNGVPTHFGTVSDGDILTIFGGDRAP